MGTNYYMTFNSCGHCGRGEQEIHIGKSSGGWCFSLNTHPDDNLNSLDDWRAAFHRCPIRDEYGRNISRHEMIKIITERKGHKVSEEPPAPYPDWPQFYSVNYAEPGPNNLLRHIVDGQFCIAQGDGTYDLMRGEFS